MHAHVSGRRRECAGIGGIYGRHVTGLHACLKYAEPSKWRLGAKGINISLYFTNFFQYKYFTHIADHNTLKQTLLRTGKTRAQRSPELKQSNQTSKASNPACCNGSFQIQVLALRRRYMLVVC